VPNSEDLVTLRGGLTVPVAALRTLWSLEARAFSLEVRDARLSICPATALTPADIADIRRHRDALVALVIYCDEVQ
jgi:hypothetical protein